jgi:CheY-like chemotaxis protein
MSGRSTDTSRRKGRAYTVTMLIENKDATYERMTRPAAHCPVLIVEDDADLREMMAQLLTLEGYETATVANGREALEYLHNAVAPNVILLDLMMPVMDGWQFRREQARHAALADIPVIIVSAAGRDRIQQIDADAYLLKPVDLDELLARVTQYCSPGPLPLG